MEDIIIVGIVFTVPIIAILSGIYKTKLKHEQTILQDQIQLEQLKHDNYMIETEKMRLELEQQKLLLETNRQALLKDTQESISSEQ